MEVSKLNYYIGPYINPYVNATNRQNFYILDKKTGDVNGDGIPDTVYLTGEKGENPFYENIKVIVQDGRTMKRDTIPLYPKYSMAYSPWLFLERFTNSSAEEIMVSLPVGGSGALTYYYVISFLNNNARYMLGPEQFRVLLKTLQIDVEYMDNYKVLVKSNKLNQSYTLDVSDRKESYEGTLYDKNGKLINSQEGFVLNQPHLYPVKFDGTQPYKLESLDDIAGTSHADKLGYTVTYWMYSEDRKAWVLDPEYFTIML